MRDLRLIVLENAGIRSNGDDLTTETRAAKAANRRIELYLTARGVTHDVATRQALRPFVRGILELGGAK